MDTKKPRITVTREPKEERRNEEGFREITVSASTVSSDEGKKTTGESSTPSGSEGTPLGRRFGNYLDSSKFFPEKTDEPAGENKG